MMAVLSTSFELICRNGNICSSFYIWNWNSSLCWYLNAFTKNIFIWLKGVYRIFFLIFFFGICNNFFFLFLFLSVLYCLRWVMNIVECIKVFFFNCWGFVRDFFLGWNLHIYFCPDAVVWYVSGIPIINYTL